VAGLLFASALGGPTPLAAEEATWKVTLLFFRQSETCDGGRGTIHVKGDKLAYFDQGMPYPDWEVTLRPDGGFDNTVGQYIHTNRRLRVKVAPGSGARAIETLNEISLCEFRYVPD
jgi:hypothetical protein